MLLGSFGSPLFWLLDLKQTYMESVHINNGETGQSVRNKINGIINELINSEQGINSIWEVIGAIRNAFSNLENGVSENAQSITTMGSQCNEHTDNSINELRKYIDGCVGGISMLAEGEYFNPEIPFTKSATVLVTAPGTYEHFKNESENSITVPQGTLLGVFFKEAHKDYWTYRTIISSLTVTDSEVNNLTVNNKALFRGDVELSAPQLGADYRLEATVEGVNGEVLRKMDAHNCLFMLDVKKLALHTSQGAFLTGYNIPEESNDSQIATTKWVNDKISASGGDTGGGGETDTFDGNKTITGNLNVGGTLAVTGAVTAQSMTLASSPVTTSNNMSVPTIEWVRGSFLTSKVLTPGTSSSIMIDSFTGAVYVGSDKVVRCTVATVCGTMRYRSVFVLAGASVSSITLGIRRLSSENYTSLIIQRKSDGIFHFTINMMCVDPGNIFYNLAGMENCQAVEQ